jgi:hypothetical protein
MAQAVHVLVHVFGAPLLVIESAEHATSQAALQTTLDLSERAGRQRHDCGSEDPFAQHEPSILRSCGNTRRPKRIHR